MRSLVYTLYALAELVSSTRVTLNTRATLNKSGKSVSIMNIFSFSDPVMEKIIHQDSRFVNKLQPKSLVSTKGAGSSLHFSRHS